MEPTQQDQPQADQTRPPGFRWLTTMALEPGMLVARPVVGLTGARATMFLATGSLITAQTIAQLIVKGVECVAVAEDPLADIDALADAVRCRESRLQQIFGNEPSAACRELMDALTAAGPTLC